MKVLVAPLDWGLGHATRCIPIIYNLLNAGFEVLIAADGHIKKLLEIEFPALPFILLEGYRVQYAHSKRALLYQLLRQVPHILRIIRHENSWLKEAVIKHKIDLIISDNRYGLYHPDLHSIFVTHQLLIKTPFLERVLQSFNYLLINKFNECWVPDNKEGHTLSGILSHPIMLPSVPVKYIGILSRFNAEPPLSLKQNKILILLSGPEPQRTLLENILTAQLDIEQDVVIIRGLPGEVKTIPNVRNVKFINHLPAKKLEKEIKQSSLIIARAGYSTIMDLITLKKQSILIPTPGQTEQEYLGGHLNKNKLALCVPQEGFNLRNALEKAVLFPYQILGQSPGELLRAAVNELKARKGNAA